MNLGSFRLPSKVTFNPDVNGYRYGALLACAHLDAGNGVVVTSGHKSSGRWGGLMSFDRRRRGVAGADRPVLVGDRRAFLSALDKVVRSRSGLACGIVTRDGVPVLHVINADRPRYAAEIGADFLVGNWRYTWAVSGQAIGPVDDPDGVAETIARALKVDGQAR